MDNLHRELAPISEAAWNEIDEEAARTLTRHLAGRRIVDVHGPGGAALAAVGTGHLIDIDPHVEGVRAHLRAAKPLLELRVPFALDRQSIDDVERGSGDSDWQAVKDAARQIAFAEDRAIFEGYAVAQIEGIRQANNNPPQALPADARSYPDAITQAISRLRIVGVNGPYTLALSADAYTLVSETRDSGYPVLEHLQRLVDGEIIWAPAITGAFVLTSRGGDFALHLGQDVSVGYLSHDDSQVRLYLQETFTFIDLTAEAAVALTAPGE